MSESPKNSGKVITYDELKKHSNKENLYLLVHGKVYDVSKFIDEHPGGDEVMLAEAAKDATEAFEDVGHSDEARALLPNLYVGDFEKDGVLKIKEVPSNIQTGLGQHEESSSSVVTYLIPLGLLGAYFAWRYYSS